MNKVKFSQRSLIASLIVLFPAILFFVYMATTSSGFLENGDIDNAPMRAGWMLLFLSPILFLMLFLFYYVSSRLLSLFDKLSFIYHEIIVLLFSLIFGYVIAHDSVQYFLFSTSVFGLWLSAGVLSWHYLEGFRYSNLGA